MIGIALTIVATLVVVFLVSYAIGRAALRHLLTPPPRTQATKHAKMRLHERTVAVLNAETPDRHVIEGDT